MIELQQLSIRQGNFHLLEIDLNIARYEYCVLMGPTGCGKTTLAEAICGLRKTCGGRIVLDGQDITNAPAARRCIGYVPQDVGLFPNMRVRDQIEFGLRVRNVSPANRSARMRQLAELVDVEAILNRFPTGLSGGEQQRVALARAIAFYPKVLILDEPLSALDAATHQKLVELLQRVHSTQQVTVMHITHNESEAEALATLRVHLQQGQVSQ